MTRSKNNKFDSESQEMARIAKTLSHPARPLWEKKPDSTSDSMTLLTQLAATLLS